MGTQTAFAGAACVFLLVAGCSGAATRNDAAATGASGAGAFPAYVPVCFGSPAVPGLPRGLTSMPALDGAADRVETAFTISQAGRVTPPAAGAQGDGWTTLTVGDPSGTFCTTATDRSACEKKVAEFRVLPADETECKNRFPSTVGPSGCVARYLLYSRGDEVGVARNDEELIALMGTVDTMDEALFFVLRAGYSLACSSLFGDDSTGRTTAAGGFDFNVVVLPNCENQVKHAVVHVDYAGTVTEVSSTTSTLDRVSCAGRM